MTRRNITGAVLTFAAILGLALYGADRLTGHLGQKLRILDDAQAAGGGIVVSFPADLKRAKASRTRRVSFQRRVTIRSVFTDGG